VRFQATADVAVSPADLYAVAADLRNLPAWWIEHLNAEVEVPAIRARDAVYRLRYRLPGGLVITATGTVVAARPGRSLTYIWQGGGLRTAVGHTFLAEGNGCRTQLIADVSIDRWLFAVSPLVTAVIHQSLGPQLERALSTLGELVTARTIVRRRAIVQNAERSPDWEAPDASSQGATTIS
jgi:uncharacterized protein YndB with AHSA1/START domain